MGRDVSEALLILLVVILTCGITIFWAKRKKKRKK